MSDVKGRFMWFDLNTTDPAGAKAFYTEVIGWTLTPFNEDYEMFTGEGGPMGGVMPLQDEAKAMGAPPHWLAYIGTPDVDATAALATDLGGKLLAGPFSMPSVGRIAVIADPQGAVFGAFTPESAGEGHDDPPKNGEVSWNELLCDDWATNAEFYQALFGWQHTDTMDMGPMGSYWMYSAGAHPLGGMMNRPKEMPVNAWVHYIKVADLDAAVARVKAHGGTIVNGPMEVPGGDRIAQGVDPQGAFFALHSSAS